MKLTKKKKTDSQYLISPSQGKKIAIIAAAIAAIAASVYFLKGRGAGTIINTTQKAFSGSFNLSNIVDYSLKKPFEIVTKGAGSMYDFIIKKPLQYLPTKTSNFIQKGLDISHYVSLKAPNAAYNDYMIDYFNPQGRIMKFIAQGLTSFAVAEGATTLMKYLPGWLFPYTLFTKKITQILTRLPILSRWITSDKSLINKIIDVSSDKLSKTIKINVPFVLPSNQLFMTKNLIQIYSIVNTHYYEYFNLSNNKKNNIPASDKQETNISSTLNSINTIGLPLIKFFWDLDNTQDPNNTDSNKNTNKK